MIIRTTCNLSKSSDPCSRKASSSGSWWLRWWCLDLRAVIESFWARACSPCVGFEIYLSPNLRDLCSNQTRPDPIASFYSFLSIHSSVHKGNSRSLLLRYLGMSVTGEPHGFKSNNNRDYRHLTCAVIELVALIFAHRPRMRRPWPEEECRDHCCTEMGQDSRVLDMFYSFKG